MRLLVIKYCNECPYHSYNLDSGDTLKEGYPQKWDETLACEFYRRDDGYESRVIIQTHSREEAGEKQFWRIPPPDWCPMPKVKGQDNG